MQPLPKQPEPGDLVSFEYQGVQITGKLTEILEKNFWVAGAEIKETCYRVETPAQDVIISTSIIEAYNFKVIRKGSEYARLLEARDTLLSLVNPARSDLEARIHGILMDTLSYQDAVRRIPSDEYRRLQFNEWILPVDEESP